MARRALTLQTRLHARETFLKELAQRGIVSDAAEVTGMSRAVFYEWRNADPEFAQQWEQALEIAIERAEREAWRRGVEGIEKPVIGRIERDKDGIVKDAEGKEIYIREYSDGLLTTILKANKPEKYREKVDHEHRGSIAVEFVNNWRETDT